MRTSPVQTYTLLMTATITPAEAGLVLRQDPELRRSDYYSALMFWLQYDDPRISRVVFVENSGADLSVIEQAAKSSNTLNKEIEFINAPALPLPAGLHYGYAELQMIDFGLQNSKLVRKSTHLIKVTGRLRFSGLSRLLDRLPPIFEIAADSRNRGRWLGSKRGSTTTQLIIFSIKFYQSLLQQSYLELNDKYPYYIENLFFDKLTKVYPSKEIILRWPVNAEPEGHAAHSTKQYDSLGRLFIAKLRALLRIVAPRFWF